MASRRNARRSPAAQAPARRALGWTLLLALLAATLLAYQPAWRGTMLWDDDVHLTPPALASVDGLWRTWTDVSATQQYYPVTMTGFWVMNRLWGHEPLGYHLVNIVLHALSAFLVVGILRRWSVPGAMVAGVIFALHPVHVESVAWMTEFKNTLSGVLYLTALIAYLRFDEARRPLMYAAALSAFVLALGSKTVTATLPAALLVVFWWRRGRIDWRNDVLPLVPFFAVGIAAGIGTAWLEHTWVGQGVDWVGLSPVERLLLAGRVVWFYAGKIVWPVSLIFMYPRWAIDQTAWWQYLYLIAAIAAVAGCWVIRRRTRAPLAAALFFGGTLFPVLGFANVFPFRYSFVADHFQYLASLGLIAALAAAITIVVSRVRPGFPERGIAVCIGILLAILTFQQSRQYASAESLYRTTLARNPDSFLAQTNLASLLLDGPAEGWSEAERLSRETIRVAPQVAEPYVNLGVAQMRLGRHAEAEQSQRDALRINPRSAPAHANLAMALAAQAKPDEAIAAYEESLKVSPRQPAVLHLLGALLASRGRAPEAIVRLREAVALGGPTAEMHMDLGNLLALTGKVAEATAEYDAAVRARPAWGEARSNLAFGLRRLGRLEEAAAMFAAAAEVLPARRAELLTQLGMVLVDLGRRDEAARQFEEALRLQPDFAPARESLLRLRR